LILLAMAASGARSRILGFSGRFFHGGGFILDLEVVIGLLIAYSFS